MGIEQLINLTTINTSLDVELMSVVLKFWSKSINSFLLPFSHISITLSDVTILIGLPIQGSNALCLLDIQDSPLLAIEVSSTTQILYSATIRKWHDVTRIPSTIEHVEYLWIRLCRYVFFPTYGKSAMEYLPMAKTLTLGRPYALGTLLLALV